MVKISNMKEHQIRVILLHCIEVFCKIYLLSISQVFTQIQNLHKNTLHRFSFELECEKNENKQKEAGISPLKNEEWET